MVNLKELNTTIKGGDWMFDIKVVKIHRLQEENSRIKAFVDVGINDAILIKGLRVINGSNGLFVSMPTEQGKNEKWYERVRCLNKDIRGLLNDKILEAYNKTF
jgi:stage V sporulation protein G